MAFILNIDTATEHASVCIAQNETVLATAVNHQQKNHAAWVQPAIQQILQQTGLSLQQLSAVAIAAGPGSYTGLRVGMATAKGLCYALQIPLIAINTLQIIATAIKKNVHDNDDFLICAMIDARRMEVYTATYNMHCETVNEPAALILNSESFTPQLLRNKVYFGGNGAGKLKNILQNNNAYFIEVEFNAADMVALSYAYYTQKKFENLAYTEPQYLKAFHFSSKSE
jgi:tRNA threonylcarbamoyladenosine biosynthesis protein TsaB